MSIIGCIFSKTHLKKIAKYHTLINKSGNSGNRSIYPLISQQSVVHTFSSFCSHCPHFPRSQTNTNHLFCLGFVGKKTISLWITLTAAIILKKTSFSSKNNPFVKNLSDSDFFRVYKYIFRVVFKCYDSA